jgi:two-component system sensor histidine kinase UhpB
MADTQLADEAVASPSVDLKWSLTLRVVAVALSCLLIAAALTLFETYRDVLQANENVADIVTRQLQNQLFRIEANIDLAARFPDWEPVGESVQGAGQCIRYIQPDGSAGRSACVGYNRAGAAPPAWLSALGSRLLAGHIDVARPVSYHAKSYGTLVVTTESAVVLATIWKDVSGLFGFTALVVAAICGLQFIAIRRALGPTRHILAGLDRLAHGDLSCRLPNFRLIELARIAEVFNTLAANLDRATRERTALAARLVDGHEQERRHLARELHDEYAQALSAVSAIAASIKLTAEAQCPELVPEASTLLQNSSAMMKALRTTLHTLRPPEIDDLGLAASLAALARDQERRACGKLDISLQIDGDLTTLSPATASHVYRIVQEGLTNIGKHAHATLARVELGLHASADATGDPRRWLTLIVEDNGFGPIEAGVAEPGGGLGLVGIRERVMALGGQLDLVRLPHRSFTLRAMIPCEAPEAVR